MSADERDPVDAALDGVLDRARHLVANASALAIALADVGIDLPPSSASHADGAQLRAVAGLYLAAELEAAGVVPVVEALAALGASGGLRLNVGQAAEPLATFWHNRNNRPTAAERSAAFVRLFGHEQGPAAADGPAYDDFFDDMIELSEALYNLTNWAITRPGAASPSRLASAARRRNWSTVSFPAAPG